MIGLWRHPAPCDLCDLAEMKSGGRQVVRPYVRTAAHLSQREALSISLCLSIAGSPRAAAVV